TPSIAQIALRFGANDLDGTVVEEKIYHDAGAKTSEFTSRNELERLIRAAGRTPVERDTLYNRIDRSKLPPIPPATPAGLVSLSPSVSPRKSWPPTNRSNLFLYAGQHRPRKRRIAAIARNLLSSPVKPLQEFVDRFSSLRFSGVFRHVEPRKARNRVAFFPWR